MGRTKFKKISVFFIIWLLPILFYSCGIPHYVNFDNKINIVSHLQNEENRDLIEFDVKFNSTFYSTVDNFTTKPSIKLFYAISDSNSITAPILFGNENYSLNLVSSFFNTNYKKSSGNGIELPQESEGSLAAFYLYTDSNDKIRQFTISRSNLPKTNKEGVIVGTFSNQHYSFNKPPQMDYILQSDNLQQSFKLVYNDGVGLVEFNKKDGTSIDLFGPYNKGGNFKDDFYLADDKGFYEGGDLESRYIHIWGAIYGGRGSFTNIWWSNLEYLGYFEI